MVGNLVKRLMQAALSISVIADISLGKNATEEWTSYTGPNYRKEVFPKNDTTEPMEVGISVLVRNLPKIDEVNGVMFMEVNLRVKWQDERLTIPPWLAAEDYIPLDPVILKDIWVPDLYIDHSSEAITPSVLTSIASVWIYGDGTVDYSGNMYIRVACRMNYTWFPRDHQICSIRIESYAYTLNYNVYKWVPPGLEIGKDISNEQFNIRFEKTDPYTRVQDVYGTYPALAFRVHLTRQITYVLLQVYLPSGLFVVVSFVSLLVPPDAIPGRMTLCITTILTMSALLGVAMQSTPQVSYTRAIDIWLLVCLSIVSVVLLEFGIVIKLREWEKTQSTADTAGRFIKTVSPQVHPTSITTNASKKERTCFTITSSTVEKVSLVLLPLIFLVFNAAYWSWFMSGSEEAMPQGLSTNSTL
ncbi:glycine receptor subunit alpha-3-like [Penaeus japonicus]|uniref:glycine receptor subunit alpha-3-like n=1 Tax=Penaeus japonicus TaxID=27405 RepID=UPI001C71786F|nr:glycine receptor subunit alpha-3-like [Penaeus japonicus]